jgi:hypothetical protein
MAINAADARQLARVILMAYGEDVGTIAGILGPLRTEFPTIGWMTELTAIATTWQPFLTSGLSIQWWLNEVDRLSQP